MVSAEAAKRTATITPSRVRLAGGGATWRRGGAWLSTGAARVQPCTCPDRSRGGTFTTARRAMAVLGGVRYGLIDTHVIDARYLSDHGCHSAQRGPLDDGRGLGPAGRQGRGSWNFRPWWTSSVMSRRGCGCAAPVPSQATFARFGRTPPWRKRSVGE